MRRPFVGFGVAVLGFYVLLWGSQILFPGGTVGTVVFVLTTVAGIALVQPGWNIWPRQSGGYWVVLYGLLLGSAVLAPYVLKLAKIPTPYDTRTLNIVMLLPGLIAVTGVEEVLFRHVLFRWLERQRVTARWVVIATAVAFGGAHLGQLLIGGEAGELFYLLQSLYMVWVGVLLGELRRVSESWVLSWAGHAVYNVVVLFVFSLNGDL